MLGGDYRALTVVRSLGRKQVPVWVVAEEQAIAGTSRYARRTLRSPNLGNEAAEIAHLLDLARRNNLSRWTLFPTTDEHAALIARNQRELSTIFQIVTSPWEKLRCAYDKRLTYRRARKIGVDQPRTWYPANRQELARLDLEYPVILKPAIKAAVNRFTEEKCWKVRDRVELLARYDEATALIDRTLVVVQEIIPGGGEHQFSYGALCIDGQPLASLVAQRRRQYPIEFGRSSSYVETVEQPEIEAAARPLLSAINYHGLIEIEFKRDPRDRKYKVLDLNPRIWGWNSIAARAGVDFPYLFWRLSQQRPLPELKGMAGVKWMRMVTDVPAAITEMRSGRLSPTSYLRSFRGPLEPAIYALDDPMPCLLEVPLLSFWKLKRWIRLRRDSHRWMREEQTALDANSNAISSRRENRTQPGF